MPAAIREEKAALAVEYSSKGWHDTEIAEELEIDRKTVKKLIDDELAKRSEHRAEDKERAIAVYAELIREGWSRLEKLDSRSLNVSGILNAIRAAQERIDKITGAEAPLKTDNRHRHEPSAAEREAREFADEIARVEAEIVALESGEARASGPEEGAG